MLGVWLGDLEKRGGKREWEFLCISASNIMKYGSYVPFLVGSSMEIDFTISILQMKI